MRGLLNGYLLDRAVVVVMAVVVDCGSTTGKLRNSIETSISMLVEGLWKHFKAIDSELIAYLKGCK